MSSSSFQPPDASAEQQHVEGLEGGPLGVPPSQTLMGAPCKDTQEYHLGRGAGDSGVSTRAHSPLGAGDKEAAAGGQRGGGGPATGTSSVAAEALGVTSVRTAVESSDEEEEETEGGWGGDSPHQPKTMCSFVEGGGMRHENGGAGLTEKALRVAAVVAAADFPESCRDTWERMHVVLVKVAASLHVSLGLEGLVVCMHAAIGAASLLFFSCWALLLSLPFSLSFSRFFLVSPALGLLLGFGHWGLHRLHAKTSYHIYSPTDIYGGYRPSVGLRLLQLLLHGFFSLTHLFLWLTTFLLLCGGFSLAALTVALPAVILCRMGFRFFLEFLSLSLSKHSSDSHLVTSLREEEFGEGGGGAPTLTHHAGGGGPALAKRLEACWDVGGWIAWVAALPDFYGPSDVSIRPSCFDIYFYLGAPSEGRKAHGAPLEGPPTSSLGFLHHQHPGDPHTSAAAERLLQQQAPDEVSAAAGGAAGGIDMPYEADELVGALEETAEEYAAFLGLPGGGPCLKRSCCCLVQGAQRTVSLILMWIDGSLTFISLGGLTLLCGGCFPAGLLLSGAPLFAATCAFSAAVTVLTKQLLFSLLHAQVGGPPSSSRRGLGTTAGGAPNTTGYYRLAEEEGGAVNTFKKIKDTFSIKDILNRLKSHSSSSSNSSSSSSIAEKQQQLLQRLHTGADLESGGPFHDHQQQQQQQHPLGPMEHVPALSAAAGESSGRREQQLGWGAPQSYGASSLEEGEEEDDFDGGTETKGDSERMNEPLSLNS